MSEPLSHSQELAFARTPCYVKPKAVPSAVKRWATGFSQEDPPQRHSSDISVTATTSIMQGVSTPPRVNDTAKGTPRTTMTPAKRLDYGRNSAMEQRSNGGKVSLLSGEQMSAGQSSDTRETRHKATEARLKEVPQAWADSGPPRAVRSSVLQWLISPKSPPPVLASRVPPTGCSARLHSSVVVPDSAVITTDQSRHDRRGGRFHPPVVLRGDHSPPSAPLVFLVGHPRNAVRPPPQARALVRLPGSFSSSPRSLRLTGRGRHVWTGAALDELWGTLPADSATSSTSSAMMARQIWRDAPLHRQYAALEMEQG